MYALSNKKIISDLAFRNVMQWILDRFLLQASIEKVVEVRLRLRLQPKPYDSTTPTLTPNPR